MMEKSPCSYFILQIKQGFMREFGLRCQRGPLQSCFKNGSMEKSNTQFGGGGGEEASQKLKYLSPQGLNLVMSLSSLQHETSFRD